MQFIETSPLRALDEKKIDGLVAIKDAFIVDLLKQYRSDIHFMNTGGAKILTKYLAVEQGIYVNHKKVYRICRENNPLLYNALSVKKKLKKRDATIWI